MSEMAKANGKLVRLTDAELAAITRPAKITDPAKRRAAIKRATTGLRVGVRVTPSLYRPQ
jgi:hypothetical protein